MEVLVIQPFPGIGDVIWFLPHMHALAEERGPLTLMTKPRSCADKLLAGDRRIKRVVWLERNPGRHDGIRGFFRLVGEIRRRRYTEAWLFHRSSRYAWALYLAGVPVTYGYGRKWQRFLLTHDAGFLDAEQLRLHAIDKAGLVLEKAGVPFVHREPDFFVSAAVLQDVARHYGLEPKRGNGSTCTPAGRCAVFALGSSSAQKQWGRENFLALARCLGTRGVDKVFLAGGTAEQEMMQWMQQRQETDAPELVSLINLPFARLAALIKCTDFCVGNDTGILNLAAAVRVPTYGLFGVTRPLTNSASLFPVTPPADTGMQGISVDSVVGLLARDQRIAPA